MIHDARTTRHLAGAPTDRVDAAPGRSRDPRAVEALDIARTRGDHLAQALAEGLNVGGDRDTGAPGEVVDVIDDVLRRLHKIRSEASQENRRRMDAAMSRSAKLLGIDGDA